MSMRDLSSLTENFKNNMDTLLRSATSARSAKLLGQHVPSPFDEMSLIEIQRTIDDISSQKVSVELILGRETKIGSEAHPASSVIDSLRNIFPDLSIEKVDQ